MRDSNVLFPIRVINKLIGFNIDLKLISVSSYLQLPGVNLNSNYSLSKSDFIKWYKDQVASLSEVFLFDTFGLKDNRGKLIDIFIYKILKDEEIIIPKNEILVNISEINDIAFSLFNTFNLKYGQYCVLSPHTLSLLSLIETLSQLIGKEARIKRIGEKDNLFCKINYTPKNIFKYRDDKNLCVSLTRKINEIRNIVITKK